MEFRQYFGHDANVFELAIFWLTTLFDVLTSKWVLGLSVVIGLFQLNGLDLGWGLFLLPYLTIIFIFNLAVLLVIVIALSRMVIEGAMKGYRDAISHD